jgi:hypothetical protein
VIMFDKGTWSHLWNKTGLEIIKFGANVVWIWLDLGMI